MRLRRGVSAPAVALVLALASGPAAAATPAPEPVDLGPHERVPLTADGPRALAGQAVAVADVDGDGRQDVVIGMPGAAPAGRAEAGVVEVRFGPTLRGAPLVIEGAAPGDRLGAAVADAGDQDVDGADDLVLGAYQASPSGRTAAGIAYVVHGRGPGRVDLSDPAAPGVLRVEGAQARDDLGRAVSLAGDQDGDGIPDLLLGAPGAGRRAGGAWIVAAGGATGVLDLAQPGSSIGSVAGDDPGALLGSTVAGGEDLTGDGRPDVALGAPEAGSFAKEVGPGRVVVIAGPVGPGRAALGPGAIGIPGPILGSLLGSAIAMGGDLSGDGRPDLLAGAWNLPRGPAVQAGGAYVVRSPLRPPVVLPQDEGPSAFAIFGAYGGDAAGRAVAAAGDLDGDGRPDALVGSGGAGVAVSPTPGSVDVVRGGRRDAAVDLAAAADGAHVNGERPGDRAGDALAAGDIDGDGRPDLVIGAPGAAPFATGAVYVVPDPYPLALRLQAAGTRCAPALRATVDGAALAELTVRAAGRRTRRSVRFAGPGPRTLRLLLPRGTAPAARATVALVARGHNGVTVTRRLGIRAPRCPPGSATRPRGGR